MEHEKFPPVAVCLAELSPSIKQRIPMPMQAKNLLSTLKNKLQTTSIPEWE